MLRKNMILLAVASMVAANAWASEGSQPIPKDELVKLIASEASSGHLVPSPGAMLNAIKGLDGDWAHAGVFSSSSEAGNRQLAALRMGIRGADGFIAVSLKDKGKLTSSVSAVQAYARLLGIQDAVLKRGDEFKKLASSDDWSGFNQKMEDVTSDVEGALVDMNDEDLLLLMQLGGWLEALNAASGVLSGSYHADSSSVLAQKGLLDDFVRRLDVSGMANGTGDTAALVKQISSSLSEIRALVDRKGAIPEADVKKIHDLASKLIAHIEEV